MKSFQLQGGNMLIKIGALASSDNIELICAPYKESGQRVLSAKEKEVLSVFSGIWLHVSPDALPLRVEIRDASIHLSPKSLLSSKIMRKAAPASSLF